MSLKKLVKILFAAVLSAAMFSCERPGPDNPVPQPPDPPRLERTGESGITYQLLVYSFADSDGDGIGDFKGIESRLDYLKELGVQALWLSPIHPSPSYHCYDVEDYYGVNPKFGTEEDFKSLLQKAHGKGIKIYIDYVLNHSSSTNPWFVEGKSNPESKYRSYYHFSETQKSGYASTVSGTDPGRINVKFTLKCNSTGTPQTLKAEKVASIVNSGSPKSGKYLWYGDGEMLEFYSAGNDTYTLSLELETSWGVLVRTSTSEWGAKKFGATGASSNKLVWGVPLNLKSNSEYDILMPWMGNIWYQAVFDATMPDLNYGPASACEQSETFKDICAAADKWIQMGVDGFRLDAVKHIYDNENSDENPTFLAKFYEHCNATYKSAGGQGDIYMVGEMWSEPDLVAPYYKGLPAFFEFAFWDRLVEGINSFKGSDFASTISGYHGKYTAVRSNAIAATKLTNHDQDRAGSLLGRNQDKMKLAAAVLLTAGGEPYIYQGEELGYWGTRAGGDAYVRTPILWTSDISSAASGDLGGQVDKSMLSAGISVENQAKDDNSMLNVYRRLGVLRDSCPALAKGDFTPYIGISQPSIAAWYRSLGSQKVLVLHNFGVSQTSVNISGNDLSNLVFANGNVSVNGNSVTIPGLGSAVFIVQL